MSDKPRFVAFKIPQNHEPAEAETRHRGLQESVQIMNDDSGMPKSQFIFSQLESRRRRLKRLKVFDIQHLTLPADLSNQPGQNLARPDLHESTHALVQQQL